MRIHPRLALILLTLVLSVLAIFIYLDTNQGLFGVRIDPPKPLPGFSLSSDKALVSLSSFSGKIVVLYFGYTNCPDVCPTTLANLRLALELLDPKQAEQVQVIFISVDWKRDTPEKMTSYAQAFNPAFIGLTGSQAQIDELTKEYGIFYKLNPADANGFYAVEHTASASVMDRQGRLVEIIPYNLPPSEIAADLKVLLGK